VLVDAGAKSKYYKLLGQDECVTLESQPFQGGFEDFLQRPSYFEDDVPGPERSSLLDDLMFYWAKELPPAFDAQSPTLLELAYYPLKIVAAEWVVYVEVMHNSIQYEYSTETFSKNRGLEKLDSDLYSLQVWGVRIIQTMHKLDSVIRFVKSRTAMDSKDPKEEPYGLLVRDYEHIASMVRIRGRRLENTVPIVTSVAQIVDIRRSLREAANVTRLTNLALLFGPLSFVSGLLSINDAVTAHGLAIYFAVAIPLCALVFFVARPMKSNVLAKNVCRLRKLSGGEV
jgi:hypothetical protein